MLTVLCWLWEGRRPGCYGPEKVNALARMLKKHLNTEYRLLCVTDRPKGITECETFPLWSFPNVLQTNRKAKLDCYRRLKLFDPETAKQFGDRIMSIDLDIIPLRELSVLITDDDFKAAKGTVSHINGSIYVLKSGTNEHVWRNFDPKTVVRQIDNYRTSRRQRIVGSDQAWMSIQMPHAKTWGRKEGIWTIKQISRFGIMPKNARLITFPGKIKPWDETIRRKFPTLYQEYMQHHG